MANIDARKSSTYQAITSVRLDKSLQQARYRSLERLVRIVSILYLLAAGSHLILLPAGKWIMFSLATVAGLSLLLAHQWMARNPARLGATNWIAALLFATILGHSWLRLLFAHGSADIMYVGFMAVAMALVPTRFSILAGFVVVYVVGWFVVYVNVADVENWRPLVGPLTMMALVAMGIRHLQLKDESHMERLQLVNKVRRGELEESTLQLVHQAYHDSLTTLPNRSHFTEHLASAFDKARHSGSQFAVLYMDLDRFKVVNDSLGHHMGDRLLQALARRLQRFVRPSDTIARFGGDEFALLLTQVELSSDALTVAERLHAVLDEPFLLDAYEVQVGASIGIAMYRPEYESVDAMLRDADIAMYKAKNSEVNQLVFDGEMHAEAVTRLELEVDLRRALRGDQLRVYYQPIVDLRTGHTLGLEALVRWQHPERGLLNPGQFLSMAEETGLILPVGEKVLEQACSDLKSWLSLPNVDPNTFVSVNVSAREFGQTDFETSLRDVLVRTGLPAENLWLEITENSVIEQPDRAEAQILRLLEMGARVVVDDFGVGYSSLSYLQRFAFSVVKLDRSFIENDDGWRIVDGMLTIAGGLDLGVVAEGIEHQRQIELLEELGCIMGQGFFFARPMPAEDVPARLETPVALRQLDA